ncbi:MAG TPA: hypothetical protein EYP33_06685 [Pyrodictium sp.]|nr:hypothetical protein [Pyrodictium sp.]
MRALSAPLTEAILVVAAITAAMVVASAVLYNASYISNRMAAAGAGAGKYISERVAFVYAFVNSSDNCHHIFLKNVGDTVIGDIGSSTLIIGNSTYAILLNYNPSGASSGCGCWSYTEVENPNGAWEPRETIEVLACPPTVIEPPYRFVMTLSSGVKLSESYTG